MKKRKTKTNLSAVILFIIFFVALMMSQKNSNKDETGTPLHSFNKEKILIVGKK